MREMYVVILFVVTFTTGILAARYDTAGEKYRLDLKLLLWASAILTGAFFLATFLPFMGTAVFFFTIYQTTYVWVSLLFLFFALDYSRLFNLSTPARIVALALCVIDNIYLLSNLFTGAIINVFIDKMGEGYIWLSAPTEAFFIHEGICNLLLLAFIGIFVYKLFTDPLQYKIQYGIVIGTIVFCETLVFILNLSRLNIDFNPIKFPLVSMMFIYLMGSFVSAYLKSGIFKGILEKSRMAVVLFDQHDRCVEFNDFAKRLFKGIYLACSKDDFIENYLKVPSDKIDGRRMTFKDEDREIIVNTEYAKLIDKEERYTGSYFFFYDITKEEEENALKISAVSTDPLTGLVNEAGFYIKVKEILDAYPEEKFNIIATNISQFKLVNEVLGRHIGDEVLKLVGNIMKSHNERDTVCGRISSDHFGILVPASVPLDEIESTVNDSVKEAHSALSIVTYFGVYEIEDKSLSPDIMFEYASIALSSIKHGSSERVVFYEENMKEKALSDNKLLADFDGAISGNQFVLYFQPQVDSNTGKVVGAEALIRWQHPERGFLSPYFFIGLFEEYGLLYELDKHVWDTAAKTIRKLTDMGLPLPISVNISANDIFVGNLHQIFLDIVKKYDISPSMLRLEITETAVMLDMDKLRNLVCDLQKDGFVVEMDDFGSGYSSLNTLKDIPVDVIKTDMLFMSKTENKKRSDGILKSIVNLADTLDTTLISEGVETEEQVLFLKGLGCHIIQGYFYSKPIPIEELVAFLKDHGIGEMKK